MTCPIKGVPPLVTTSIPTSSTIQLGYRLVTATIRGTFALSIPFRRAHRFQSTRNSYSLIQFESCRPRSQSPNAAANSVPQLPPQATTVLIVKTAALPYHPPHFNQRAETKERCRLGKESSRGRARVLGARSEGSAFLVSSYQHKIHSRVPSGEELCGCGRADKSIQTLGSSISRSEHTVVNIGDPDGPPRLVSTIPKLN